jgi:uncharacterized protein
MFKILFLALAIWIVISILKSYSRNIDSTVKKSAKLEDMVQCAQCGVHLPESESVHAHSHFYCSEAHSKLHKQ